MQIKPYFNHRAVLTRSRNILGYRANSWPKPHTHNNNDNNGFKGLSSFLRLGLKNKCVIYNNCVTVKL